MANITELKKYLKNKSADELTEEILTLFKSISPVQDYYKNKLGSSVEVLEKYKKEIEKKIFPSTNFKDPGLHLKDAKKAVTEFKKIAGNNHDIADIMLFYVETGVELTNNFGDIDMPFYNSMAGMYEKAVMFIFKHCLSDDFEARCRAIVRNTSGIGWGFHDELNEVFISYYG
jgi:hypothetical protein